MAEWMITHGSDVHQATVPMAALNAYRIPDDGELRNFAVRMNALKMSISRPFALCGVINTGPGCSVPSSLIMA